MNARDRAVAEKLGWEPACRYSEERAKEIRLEDKHGIASSKTAYEDGWKRNGAFEYSEYLCFCSAATPETEWMVLEWLREVRPLDMLTRIVDILAPRYDADQDAFDADIFNFLSGYKLGDLASALADVIMEEQDAQT